MGDVGAVGFLATEQDDHGCASRFVLYSTPLWALSMAPKSHELWGACEPPNGGSHATAMGLARIARVTSRGQVLLVAVPDAEVPAALEGLGWRGLTEQHQRRNWPRPLRSDNCSAGTRCTAGRASSACL